MARAKIWLGSVAHIDGRLHLRTGQDVGPKVSYSGDRLHVSSWGGTTAIHGQLVDIEWHEQSGDEYGPGVKVESTDDDVPETDDYSLELTVATNDWLPHA
jgi:hypothetical protein